MSIMSTIFDVSIKEKRVYGSLCFELLPQQMSQSKKKYMDLHQHSNKYKAGRVGDHILNVKWYSESNVCNLGCKIV